MLIVLFIQGENENLTYVGVFDGYDGHVSSQKCIDQFHLALVNYFANINLNHSVQFIKENYKYDEINNLDRFDRSMMQGSDVFDPAKSLVSIDGGRANAKSPKSSMRSRSGHSSRQEYHELAGLEGFHHQDLSEEEMRLLNLYRESFRYAYKQMDKLLSRGRDETSKKRWSGATACTCVVENRPSESGDKADTESWIHLANCGIQFYFSLHLLPSIERV
jgi:hypothetical protein